MTTPDRQEVRFNLKLLPKIPSIFAEVQRGITRFPAALFSVVWITLFAVIAAKSEVYATTKLMGRCAGAALLSGLLGTAFCLAFERWEPSKKATSRIVFVTLNVVAVAMGFVFFVTILPDLKFVAMVRLAALSTSLTLAAFCVQHALKRPNFELTTIRHGINIGMAGFFGLVVYGGVAAILLSTDRLLGVKIESRDYWSCFVGIFCCFVPTIVLAKWPSYAAATSSESQAYPTFLRMVLLYAVMPLLVVYTLVLYIYSLKIVILSNWPHGIMGRMVLLYTLVGIVAVFLGRPLVDTEKWPRMFCTWFPRVALPLCAMMFMALYQRSAEYGITEIRYFIWLTGIIATGIMLVWSLPLKATSILVPLSFMAAALLSLGGPLGCFSVAKWSQIHRFENILGKYGILQHGKLLTNGTAIEQKDRHELHAILSYFSLYHSLSAIESLPTGFSITENFPKYFGAPLRQRAFGLSLDHRTALFDPTGYDRVFVVNLNQQRIEEKEKGLEFRWTGKDPLLEIKLHGKTIFSSNFQKHFLALIDRSQLQKSDSWVVIPMEMSEIQTIEENEDVRVRFVPMDLWISDSNHGALSISCQLGIVFVTFKHKSPA